MDLPKEMDSRFQQYTRLLIRRRRLFYLAIGLPLIFTILFTTISPPSFEAISRLLPTSEASSMGVVGILTGLFGSGGASYQDGAPGSFLYNDILQSRTVIESVLNEEIEFIDRKGKKHRGTIRELVGYGFGTEGVENFRGSNSVRMDLENGVITINSKAKDPNLVAIVVNTWVSKLDDFNKNVRITQAGENVSYLEYRLAESKKELDWMSDSLVTFLSSNRGYPSSTNPRIESIVRELNNQRDVKEQVYQLLSEEYEMAKLNKQKTTPVISILDKAVPPTKEAGPKRIPVFIFSFSFAMVILIISLTILESSDPTPSEMPVSWREIKDSLAVDSRALRNIFRRKIERKHTG